MLIVFWWVKRSSQPRRISSPMPPGWAVGDTLCRSYHCFSSRHHDRCDMGPRSYVPARPSTWHRGTAERGQRLVGSIYGASRQASGWWPELGGLRSRPGSASGGRRAHHSRDPGRWSDCEREALHCERAGALPTIVRMGPAECAVVESRRPDAARAVSLALCGECSGAGGLGDVLLSNGQQLVSEPPSFAWRWTGVDEPLDMPAVTASSLTGF